MFHTVFNAKKLQWSGQAIDGYYSEHINQSLGQAIFDSLKANGLKVAQICVKTGQTKTFDEIQKLTINTAKSLQILGCRKGDLICIFTENATDVPAIIFAAIYLGLQVAPLPNFFGRVELESYLKLLTPKLCMCDADIYRNVKKCLSYLNNGATIFTFGGSIDDSIPVDVLSRDTIEDMHLEPVEIDPFTHVAYIVVTSGTSGKYKCVQITHAAILNKIKSLKCIFGHSDIVMGYTFLCGVSGIRTLFGSILNGSTVIVNHQPFTAERYFEFVAKFNVTVSIGSAKLPTQLLDHADIGSADLSSLKWFCAGGTKVSHSVIQGISKHLPNGRFCQTYGLTETTSTVAMNWRHVKNDCVGQLVDGYEAKIINEQGERLNVGETGELCLKCPYPILRYLGSDHNVDDCLDNEGFFATGDLARFDENADLFIVDRKKEVFKYHGCHVIPSEIEEQLNKFDGIKDSCVVPIADSNFNCLPACVIVKTANSQCTEQLIYEWVANNFSFCKHLRGGVYFVDELPMNAREKVDRNLVKAMATDLFKKSAERDEENYR